MTPPPPRIAASPAKAGPVAPPSTLLEALRESMGPGGAIDLGHDVPLELWDRALLGPAAEFLRRPGKAMRARLCELGWRGAGGAPDALPPALPWIVELLHAGSLIVDDVQDDSDERRGAPALHRLVGTPLAINTGNWMYFWALALVERLPGVAAEARAALASAALRTMLACHQGQALDIATLVVTLEPRTVPGVVAATTRLKTGALMGLALRLGAAAAGADAARAEAAARLGEEIGVALQMLDDLGSVVAPGRAAKGLEDLRLGRPTWPWAWLAQTSDEVSVARLQSRVRTAHGEGELRAAMAVLGEAIEAHGRAEIRERLHDLRDAASRCLARAVGDELSAELARLEASYG